MKTFAQDEPLTEAELDRLAEFLNSCKSGKGMNVEQLDGFFAALIAGPESVMPSEYYREVFGGEMADACDFASLDEANEILGLLMRHWTRSRPPCTRRDLLAASAGRRGRHGARQRLGSGLHAGHGHATRRMGGVGQRRGALGSPPRLLRKRFSPPRAMPSAQP